MLVRPDRHDMNSETLDCSANPRLVVQTLKPRRNTLSTQ